jgi:hypothetical protein
MSSGGGSPVIDPLFLGGKRQVPDTPFAEPNSKRTSYGVGTDNRRDTPSSSYGSTEHAVDEAVPALSEGRIKALLMGSLPCYDPLFAEAYSDGMRKVSGSNRQSDTMEEITPVELRMLLCGGGKLRSLALAMMAYLGGKILHGDNGTIAKKAVESIEIALRSGILPEIFNAAASAARQIETDFDRHGDAVVDIASAAYGDIERAAEVLTSLANYSVFTPDGTLAMPTNSQLVTLAAAAASMIRVSSKLMNARLSAPTGPLTLDDSDFLSRCIRIAARLIQAHLFFGRHHRSSLDLAVLSYYSEFKEPFFLQGCCKILLQLPKTEAGETMANILRQGTNFNIFNVALKDPNVNGLNCVLDALSSTSHNHLTLVYLLISLGNTISSGPEFGKYLADNHALDFLQPAVLNTSPTLAVLSSMCVGMLAIQRDLAEVVDRSDALQLVQDVLRAITPGTVDLPGVAVLYQSDVQMMKLLIAGDSHPACQLAGLHMIAVYLPLKKNVEILSMPEVVTALRVCANSSDAFVYAASIYVLRRLNFAVPNYRDISRSRNDENSNVSDPSSWSIDQVCKWVGTQFFRSYRQRFRDGFVTGIVLLALHDEDLKEMGITSSLHRKSILLAIKGISGAAEQGAASSALPLRSAVAPSSGVDVFISYRRLGGSDFAQLLKVCLKV